MQIIVNVPDTASQRAVQALLDDYFFPRRFPNVTFPGYVLDLRDIVEWLDRVTEIAENDDVPDARLTRLVQELTTLQKQHHIKHGDDNAKED